MRTRGLKALPAALALALLAGAAPIPVSAQDTPPAASAPDAAQDQPAEENQAPKIDEPFGHAWLGAADADVTVVVFADYACPACRDAQPVIDQLLAADGKLKIVYRFLVNEDDGRSAALTSLAVARAGADWGKFHRALDAAGAPSADTISAALAAGGVDPAKLPDLKNVDPDTDPSAQELSRNGALIAQRHGTAIPAWLIGDGRAQKGFDLATLQAAIAKARGGGKR